MSNFTPAWFKKGFFNESLFCDDFLNTHQLLYSNGAFFTPDGRMTVCMGYPAMTPYRESRKTPPEGGRKSMQGERQFASCGHFVYMR